MVRFQNRRTIARSMTSVQPRVTLRSIVLFALVELPREIRHWAYEGNVIIAFANLMTMHSNRPLLSPNRSRICLHSGSCGHLGEGTCIISFEDAGPLVTAESFGTALPNSENRIMQHISSRVIATSSSLCLSDQSVTIAAVCELCACAEEVVRAAQLGEILVVMVTKRSVPQISCPAVECCANRFCRLCLHLSCEKLPIAYVLGPECRELGA